MDHHGVPVRVEGSGHGSRGAVPFFGSSTAGQPMLQHACLDVAFHFSAFLLRRFEWGRLCCAREGGLRSRLGNLALVQQVQGLQLLGVLARILRKLGC